MSNISPKSGEMGTIIRAFKSAVTRNIHAAGYDFAWQRNLWEHIIRDYNDYARIDDYITNNPLRWKDDTFYNE
jgi:REP element-mobilizing transposase RayT